MPTPVSNTRLDGLDLARFIAFVGMVIVNFSVVMQASHSSAEPTGLLALLTTSLQGRAAATFVVLAGIGLGLAAQRGAQPTVIRLFQRRAVFLLILGLLNTLVFDADILHYYAVYFLLGVGFLRLGNQQLLLLIISINVVFVGLLMVLNYDAEWNWNTYTYTGFWTPTGFIRNLFFNGWHPVIPWLAFLLFGIMLSRCELSTQATRHKMIALGAAALTISTGLSHLLRAPLASVDPELAVFAGTSPIPPTPLYVLAGIGAALLTTGLCLRFSVALSRLGVLALLAPAGRQTLTLYVAHIFIGMGALEMLQMLGNQSLPAAVTAALLFCTCAVIYALLWRRYFTRGPLEAAMRRLAG